MANEYVGWERRIFVSAAESTWGTTPGSPAWRHIPFVGQYGIKLTPESRQATPTVGVRQRGHNVIFRARPEGSVTFPLMGYTASSKSLLEVLINWSFDGVASAFPEARQFEFYDKLEAKKHTGLRVNSATISGSAGQPVQIQMSFIGKDEASVSAGSAQAISATVVPWQSDMLFEDCVFSLGGSAIEMESFSLSINNNLSPTYRNSSRPTLLPAGMRVVDFQVQIAHNATTRDALIRAGGIGNTTGQLVLKALHHGTGATGNYATATADFDVLSIRELSTDHDMNKVVDETPQYVVIKPATSSNDVDWTFGEA